MLNERKLRRIISDEARRTINRGDHQRNSLRFLLEADETDKPKVEFPSSGVRVVIDVPATLKARTKYAMFPDLVVARFDQAAAMYRIFDEDELRHIVATGRITGGSYAIKAERDHGASWGSDISQVIRWGNGQRGGRLGSKLFLAKLDAFDYAFAHLDPGITFDPDGPDEQVASFDVGKCTTGLGCSMMNVSADDVDVYRVDPNGRIERTTWGELRSELRAEPEPAAESSSRNGKIVLERWQKIAGLIKG